MADFDDILTEQKKTNDLLKKQRNHLDGRTGSGKALLDASKEQLEAQRETTKAVDFNAEVSQDIRAAAVNSQDSTAVGDKETKKDAETAANKRFGKLGDIFKKAKYSLDRCTSYKFQLFGDPALPLLLFKEVSDLANGPELLLTESMLAKYA